MVPVGVTIPAKYRIVYSNLKTGKDFDIYCMDKVYRTIKNMEANGQAKILFDERQALDQRDNGINVNDFIEWLDKR